MELKVPPGPGSSLVPPFTTAKRSEAKSAEEPEKVELSGSDQVNTHRIEQEASSNERPSPQTVCDPEAADLDHLSKFISGLNPDLDMDKTSLQHSRVLIKSQTSGTNSLDQPAQNPPETVQANFAKSLIHVLPVTPQTTESLCHKTKTTCTKFTFLPQDCSSGEGKPDSVSTEERKEPFLETNTDQDSTMTTAAISSLSGDGQTNTIPQINETSSLTPDPDSLIDLHKGPFSKNPTVISGLSATQSSSFIKQTHTFFTQSQKDHPQNNSLSPHLQQSSTSLQDPVPLVPNIVGMMSSSEIQSNSGQRQQAVDSLSTLSCIQKSAHDPCMTSSSTTPSTATIRPPVLLAQMSHLHDHPIPSPPPLTTDICQPVAVREEIRLTPQIKGPPLLVPSPASQTQIGPQPQGRVSQAALPYWTRPLSRAAVMEGSPVVLEVEVTPQPKPTVTWWVAYNELHSNTQP